MNIRPVIEVMHFHSLLRVDSSRRKAQKYATIQASLEEMMTDIMENQNLKLDKLISIPSQDLPRLTIYIGSDFGFCGSINSSEKRLMNYSRGGVVMAIGKKLKPKNAELFIHQEEFENRMDEIVKYLRDAVSGKKYSSVVLIYNRYYNSNLIRLEERQIYPVKFKGDGKRSGDFVLEGDAEKLIKGMMVSYLEYELKIAVASSYASENILRQNVTTQSLNKLDEIKEEEDRLARKERNAASFKKSIDNSIKQKVIKEKL